LKAAPTASFAPTANYLFGIATLQYTSALDEQAVSGKSCEISRQMESLLNESDTALEAGKAAKPEESTRLKTSVAQYKTRVAALKKAYCR
jgi:hypothetical protein